MFSVFKAMSGLKQLALVVSVVVALFLGFQAWLAYHDYQNSQTAKKELVDGINTQTEQLQSKDKERVKNASDAVSTVPDCVNLSRVYGSDECQRAKRQGAFENDFQTAPITEKTHLKRAGSSNTAVDRLPLPMGGVFSGSAKEQSVQGCYKEKLIDEFGLPIWMLDVDGLLVQQEVEVCP